MSSETESVRIKAELTNRLRTLKIADGKPIVWHVNQALTKYLKEIETDPVSQHYPCRATQNPKKSRNVSQKQHHAHRRAS